MKNLLGFIMLMITTGAQSQIISRFTWDSNPVTNATVGPNAISVSTAATSSANGVGGTNGLNPGTPTMDVNLTLTGSYYDVPGIDISVDFRREESEVNFFKRGNNFNFYMAGAKLNVSFRISDGAGGYITVTSGNIYNLPNDNTFHNYHFRYVVSTGIATVWVDGVSVYSYSGTAGRAMYWTGAGNAVVGGLMDATGRNIAVMDNLIIQNSAILTLPLQLLKFSAEPNGNAVLLSWSTNREVNTSRFELQRSTNGSQFETVATVMAKGGYSNVNKYEYNDTRPSIGSNYYRLKMIDADEKFTYSTVKRINLNSKITSISIFPNPATDFVKLSISNNQPASFIYTIYSLDGKKIMTGGASANSGVSQIEIDLRRITTKGMLLIQLMNIKTNETELLRVMKH